MNEIFPDAIDFFTGKGNDLMDSDDSDDEDDDDAEEIDLEEKPKKKQKV